jgi:shikimate kinase
LCIFVALKQSSMNWQMRPIVITGFMGCGKTKVARELADRLNLEMVDLDESITQREGKTPAELIVESGEPAFRAIESDVLRNVLETKAADVIALGGGAWIEEANRDLIAQYGCLSVWLDAPFEVCWARIKASGEDRPLAKSRSQALTLYERRRPAYQLAKIHVALEENLDDLVSRIEAELTTNSG